MSLRRILSTTFPAWAILLLTSAGALSAQGVLPVKSPGGPEVLDARGSFTLLNGVEVVLVEAPTPLVASLVLVKTGSSDETEANAGVSHLRSTSCLTGRLAGARKNCSGRSMAWAGT